MRALVSWFVASAVVLSGGAAGQALALELIPSRSALGHEILARGAVPIPPEVRIMDPNEVLVTDVHGQPAIGAVQILSRFPGVNGELGQARVLHVAAKLKRGETGVIIQPRSNRKPEEGLTSVFLATRPEGSHGYRLENGPLSIELGSGNPDLLASVALMGKTSREDIVRGLRLVLVGEDDRPQVFSPGPCTLELENSAEVRWRFSGPLGKGLFATVRIHAERESPVLKVSVRLENPGLSEWSENRQHVYIRSLELVADHGFEARSGHDGTDGAPRPLPLLLDLPSFRRSNSNFDQNLVYRASAEDGESSGIDHHGAVAAFGEHFGLISARRAASKEAPNRFQVAKERTTFELLPRGGHGPRHGGQYGHPARTPVTDEKSTRFYRIEGGLWKTFDLALQPIEVPTEPASVQALGTLLESPPLLAADPRFVAGSGLLGVHFPPFQDDFDASTDRYQRILRMLVDDRFADDQPMLGRIGLPGFLRMGGAPGGNDPYGWFNYGDIPWAEGYSSLHYDWVRTMCASFLASKERAFFDRGLVMASHQRDIDTLHVAGGDRYSGAQRYEKGWWHGNTYFSVPSHQWLTGLYLFHLISGDPGAREALDASKGFIMNQNIGGWKGHYGARMIGWPIDNLLTLWLLDGDPKCLQEIKAGIAAYQDLERGFGEKGFVLDTNSAYAPKGWPDTCQTWQQAIFLSALCRYVMMTKDESPLPLIGRIAHFLRTEAYIASSDGAQGFQPAQVWEFWSPTHHRHESLHLGWFVLDAMSLSAYLLKDQALWEPARDLFESLCRFHQGPAHGKRPSFQDSKTWSPIAARMMTYPNSESKILGNIGRLGMSHGWIRFQIRTRPPLPK